MNTLGDRLESIRRKRGMNQQELSVVSGITQATISRIEADKITAIRSDNLRRLAEALDTTTDYLCGKTSKVTRGLDRVLRTGDMIHEITRILDLPLGWSRAATIKQIYDHLKKCEAKKCPTLTRRG